MLHCWKVTMPRYSKSLDLGKIWNVTFQICWLHYLMIIIILFHLLLVDWMLHFLVHIYLWIWLSRWVHPRVQIDFFLFNSVHKSMSKQMCAHTDIWSITGTEHNILNLNAQTQRIIIKKGHYFYLLVYFCSFMFFCWENQLFHLMCCESVQT